MTKAQVSRAPKHTIASPFFPLCIDALRADQTLDFDLYLQTSSAAPVLYRERKLVMTQEVLDRLRDAKVKTVLVPWDQRALMNAYLEANLSAILKDPNVPVDIKSSLMYASAQELVRDVMDKPISGTTLSRSRALVGATVDFLFREDQALSSLLKITSHDYYTYTHSVNVMVYSVSLARRIGLEDEAYVSFAEATLLHDIGKSRISADIINCPGKLNLDQWNEMKRHPQLGRDILVELGVTDPFILDVVLHHHEKLTGGGYPDGLSGDEINPAVRISTISDIFDALTTRRSYKAASTSFVALRIMKEELARELDSKFFREFVGLLSS